MENPSILLHPNIPKPLHGMSPRTVSGKEWWDVQRKQAYAAAEYHCEACGICKEGAAFHQWLEAHELYRFNYSKGRMTFVRLVALCHSCHNYIHSGRLQILAQTGQISREKYETIIHHGNEILKRNKLKRPKSPRHVAKWAAWRLVIDGKKYPGKFQSREDWEQFYSR